MLMQTFTAGLGVHVHRLPRRQDRSARRQEAKSDVARKMIKMVMAINDNYLKDVGDRCPEGAARLPSRR